MKYTLLFLMLWLCSSASAQWMGLVKYGGITMEDAMLKTRLASMKDWGYLLSTLDSQWVDVQDKGIVLADTSGRVWQRDLYADVFIPRLLSDWNAYAKECYDDSTMVNWWGGPEIPADSVRLDSLGRKVMDMPSFQSTPAILVRYSKWTHREPTFSGFMEYLKRARNF